MLEFGSIPILSERRYGNMSEKYNGWTNYETWATDLWLTNDESAYMTAREIVRAGKTLTDEGNDDIVLELKHWVEDNVPELPGFNENQFPMGLFSDFINASLKEVNWFEIAMNLRE